jgi:hypothetical protein
VSSHAATDEQRLATLAAKMLDLRDLGTNDYVMGCGPAAEVLNARPTNIRGANYCVLNASGRIVIGMYDDPTVQTVEQLILRMLSDAQFASHVSGVQASACTGKGTTGFAECNGAITVRPGLPPLYVYIYDDELSSGGLYLLISDTPLNSLRTTKTFFGTVVEFFKSVFS